MPDYSALFQPMFWCRFSLIEHILFVFICFRFDKISNSWLTLKWVCQFMSIKSCPAVEVELQVVRLGSWFSTTLRIQLGPWTSSWFLGCYYSSTLCIYLKKKPPWKVTIICCTYLLWQRHATAQCMRLGRRTTCKSLFSPPLCEFQATHSSCQAPLPTELSCQCPGITETLYPQIIASHTSSHCLSHP